MSNKLCKEKIKIKIKTKGYWVWVLTVDSSLGLSALSWMRYRFESCWLWQTRIILGCDWQSDLTLFSNPGYSNKDRTIDQKLRSEQKSWSREESKRVGKDGRLEKWAGRKRNKWRKKMTLIFFITKNKHCPLFYFIPYSHKFKLKLATTIFFVPNN